MALETGGTREGGGYHDMTLPTKSHIASTREC